MKKTNHFYRFCALALSCLLLIHMLKKWDKLLS